MEAIHILRNKPEPWAASFQLNDGLMGRVRMFRRN